MHLKGGRYYHVGTSIPRKWTPLGSDLNEARRKWAELEAEPVRGDDRTFGVIARRYVREVLPAKSARTRSDNLKELENLKAVFGDVPIEAITPVHVREYMDIRGETAKVRANREKALLSHVYNKAREWGYTSAPNPCAGVKGFRENGRDIYVTDEDFRAVYAVAHPTLQDAMDIAYLTGQRPADVLKVKLADIRNDHLHIVQNKTRKHLRIAIEGELKMVIERIAARPRKMAGASLLQNEDGTPVSPFELRSRFDKARRLAGVTFQFRDIRAKAASDTGDLAHSQKLLGHQSRNMTEHYVRSRIGERVKPVR
ncbi:tyrosine-type recombinase/integrase [Burkholderia contaminans]|uniref:tyrosine-type recombinase/integrase n=1 Tax=Burkholderia contaminans TaxID=488447 RepID=UPI001CF3DD0C|nr:tyrosine-type recombinase/integrase [Burkholderia contaminans]MCA7919468.1 tyrosine-type recombinase/integrase [Burkholderia contaminans]UUX37212.1 tyrosine-type recombinase/integrase [Burkholderia contaminans]